MNTTDLHPDSDPVRLRHDAAFLSETGCDVAAAEAAVAPFDHERGKTRLLAAIALLPPASGTASGSAAATTSSGVVKAVAAAVGAIAVGAALVVASVWMVPPAATSNGDGTPTERAPTIAIQPSDVRLPEVVAPPQQNPAPDATVEPVAQLPSVTAAERRTTTPPAAPIAAPPVIVGVVEIPPDLQARIDEPAPVQPEQKSALQADYDAYLPANAAYLDSDYKAARDGYRKYIAAHPAGVMEPEAQFRLLLTLQKLGDAASAEAQARLIQDRALFSSRRSEILRVRAESLVQLGRCEEALTLLDSLAARDASELRKTCRVHR